MPPKRKPVERKTPAKPKRSKLAQQNDVSAEQELEIQEAWAICEEEDVEGYEDEKHGVIPTSKVDVVMRALGVAPKSSHESAEFRSILDPEDEGYVTYTHFFELAAIQINSKTDETKAEEVEKAYKLFTKNQDRAITLYDLQQIAKTLKENISDDVLQAMILEANGGSGVGYGANREQFQAILTRAGVFS